MLEKTFFNRFGRSVSNIKASSWEIEVVGGYQVVTGKKLSQLK